MHEGSEKLEMSAEQRASHLTNFSVLAETPE